MKEGRKPEYPEKTLGDELQRMPHTKARRFKSQARLEPTQQHWWQARTADVLTVTPRVAPNDGLFIGVRGVSVLLVQLASFPRVTDPTTDPTMPNAWQGSRDSTTYVTGKVGLDPWIPRS